MAKTPATVPTPILHPLSTRVSIQWVSTMDIKMVEDLEEVVEDCPLLSGDLMDHLGMVINTDQFEKYFNLAFQMEA